MLHWRLSITPGEVKERLQEEVDDVGVPVPLAGEGLIDLRPGERWFLGSVSRFGFSVLVRTGLPSAFSMICTGTIRERPDGCEVSARFHFHALVVFFFWVSLLWSLTILLFLYEPRPYPSPDWWLSRIFVPAGLVVLAAMLVVYARARCRSQERRLRMLLEQLFGPALDGPARDWEAVRTR